MPCPVSLSRIFFEPTGKTFEPTNEMAETPDLILSQSSLFRLNCPVFPFHASSRMFDRLNFLDDDLYCSWKQKRTRTWIRGFGGWNDLGSSVSLGDLEMQTVGFAVGLDQQVGRNWLWGFGLGGNRSRFEQKINGNKENLSAYFLTAFTRTTLERLFFDLEGGFGRNDSFDWKSTKTDQVTQWHFKGEMGTWWEQGLGKMEPYVGLRYVNLDLKPSDESQTTLQVGIRYSWKTKGTFSVLTPRFYGGVLRELGDRHLVSAASFTDTPTVFWIPYYEVPETRFFFGGGFTSSMGTSLDLYFRYTAEVASSYASHVLWFGMNWCY